ncbi:MAG: hypothetical protein KatS3mg121_0331 [Gammaproteobacteria bacterium]|nr:MAG: hypothetical protein KatS3mg121_0331 [Gammaproteobacteria bacterium]
MAPEDSPLRVSVLGSSLGSGHWQAALALQAALQAAGRPVQVHLVDFWSLLDRRVAAALRGGYLHLVQHAPELYERLYRLDQGAWRRLIHHQAPPPPELMDAARLFLGAPPQPPGEGTARPLDRLLYALLTRAVGHGRRLGAWWPRLAAPAVRFAWWRLAARLADRLAVQAPHCVAATQMLPAALYALLRRRGRMIAPLLAVPTDYGLHNFWLRREVDLYCLPHESLRGALPETARTEVTGIPLRPPFADPPPQAAARAALDLPPGAPVALVLGGGLALGVAETAAKLLAAAPEWALLVVAGRNTAEADALERLAAAQTGRLRVYGWVEPETMVKLMRAADVIVGKPGGLTVAEALACGRPLLATRCLRGQESFNVAFLEREGVGGLVERGGLPAALESLRGRLAEVQGRAWALGRRDAAARVARCVFDLAREAR